MAEVTHAELTGSELHEPKGVSSASNNAIAQASAGSVSWDTEINPSKLTLSDTVRKTKTVSLLVAGQGALNAPDFVKMTDDGFGSTGIYTLGFNKTTEEEVLFDVVVPPGYKEGTDIVFKLFWAPSDATAGDVVWEFEYVRSKVGSAFGNSTVAEVTESSPGVSKQIVATTLVTVDGTGVEVDDVFVCRLARKAGSASDTYDNNVYAGVFDFEYEADKIGADIT